MQTFTSSTNPKIKLIRALRQRKQRDATGLFVVEGIRHVGEVAEASEAAGSIEDGWLEYLCYCPDLLTSDFAHELVQKQEKRGLPCYAVSAATFETLAEKENPQDIRLCAWSFH